jgi:hypothetical protein
VKEFVNEYHNQMADLLDVDPATFQPSVHTKGASSQVADTELKSSLMAKL